MYDAINHEPTNLYSPSALLSLIDGRYVERFARIVVLLNSVILVNEVNSDF